MRYLLYLLKRYRVFLLFLVLEAVALSLYFSTDYYLKARAGLSTNVIQRWLSERMHEVTDYFQLEKINQQLELENILLRERLESTLSARVDDQSVMLMEYGRFKAIPARVVSNSVARQYNFFTINRGSHDGVKPQTAVVAQSSVAGIVVGVTSHYATVISLLNKDLKISAQLAHTGHFGSLYWDGTSSNSAVLDHMPHHIKVQPGDTVETSGYSSIFPSGIPIGVVESVKQQGGSFLQIKVRLITDFQSLNQLYILTDRHGAEMDSLQAIVAKEQRNE